MIYIYIISVCISHIHLPFDEFLPIHPFISYQFKCIHTLTT